MVEAAQLGGSFELTASPGGASGAAHVPVLQVRNDQPVSSNPVSSSASPVDVAEYGGSPVGFGHANGEKLEMVTPKF